MGTRISNSILYRAALSNVNTALGRLSRTQEKAASGLRINHLSDDPVGVRAATLLKAGIDQNSQYNANITRAKVRVNSVSLALSDTNEALIDTRELILRAANGTYGAGQLNGQLAPQARILFDRLLTNANTQLEGGHLFSGYASNTAAFDSTGTFQADTNEVRVGVEEGVDVPVTLNGDRVFGGSGGGENLFQLLTDLRTELESAAPDQNAIRQMLDRVDAGQNQISVARAQIGGSEQQLEEFEGRNAQRKLDLTQRLSIAQDADSIEVFSDLVKEETMLQASLAVSARILQPTLLEYLG